MGSTETNTIDATGRVPTREEHAAARFRREVVIDRSLATRSAGYEPEGRPETWSARSGGLFFSDREAGTTAWFVDPDDPEDRVWLWANSLMGLVVCWDGDLGATDVVLPREVRDGSVRIMANGKEAFDRDLNRSGTVCGPISYERLIAMPVLEHSWTSREVGPRAFSRFVPVREVPLVHRMVRAMRQRLGAL